MRICLFGAGSLGSALGGMLSAANEVTLVGRKPHVDAVRRNGLRLTGDERKVVRVHAHTSVRRVAPPELLIITTKAYDTAEAVRLCRDWADEGTFVLTLQNGLGNLELLREWKGDLAFGGTTTMGAALSSPGVVRVSGLGKTVIGSDRDPEGARLIARAFEQSGVPTLVSKNTQGEIWSKAIVNSCINPLTSILRVRNGALLKSAVLTHLMDDICAECEQVARAMAVKLPAKSMRARIRAVADATSGNLSSMLQDVMRGRRTEMGFLNEAICRIAAAKGVPTPLNCALVAIVESLERWSVAQGSVASSGDDRQVTPNTPLVPFGSDRAPVSGS